MRSNMLPLWCMCIIGIQLSTSVWGGSDKVLLKDISVLSLYNNRMTTSRRSGPVPQLKCVGGNAGCSTFTPQVVQCYNRGTDGFDVQWECKSDMDNAYRFGQIEVTCEGYEYADDPYVLRGSCGLEYTLDLTKEGHQHKKSHDHYGESQNTHQSSYAQAKTGQHSSWAGDVVLLIIVGGVVYAIYRTCIANTGDYDSTPGNDDDATRRNRGNPPPPGFRQSPGRGNQGGNDDNDDGASCGGSRSSSNTHSNQRPAGGMGGAGGFWGGAGMGGLLGYMLGSRTGTYQQPGYGGYGGNGGWGGGGGLFGGGRNHYGGGGGMFGGRSGGGGGMFGGGGGSSFGGGSTGTRTASGFGGTRRR